MLCYNDEIKMTNTFADLLSLAACEKIHPDAISYAITHSNFVRDLDSGNCKDLLYKTAQQLFMELFHDSVATNHLSYSSTVIFKETLDYQRFYWCGWAYMQLFFEYKKSLSYIFLIMPLSQMANIYPVYHEMDKTQLFEYFEAECKKSTIMKRLIKNSKKSARKLSELSGINYETINYYKKSDEHLYRASFQNIYPLCLVLEATEGVFLKKVLPTQS